MKLLSFVLILGAFSSFAQDCGYMLFKVDYSVYSSNYHFSVSLKDECDVFQLVVQERGKEQQIDTFYIRNENVALKRFVRKLDQVNIHKLNSLSNHYLLDGLFIDYTYMTRQNLLINEQLHFPIVSNKALLFMEDELDLLLSYHQLYKQYLSDEQKTNWKMNIQAMVWGSE